MQWTAPARHQERNQAPANCKLVGLSCRRVGSFVCHQAGNFDCSLSIALRIHRRGGPGPAAKLLQVFEDPIGGLPLAPEREADDLADVGASSILIVDFRHRA